VTEDATPQHSGSRWEPTGSGFPATGSAVGGRLPDGDRHGFGDRFGPGARLDDDGGSLPPGPSNSAGSDGS
jgi:hypothetical protein